MAHVHQSKMQNLCFLNRGMTTATRTARMVMAQLSHWAPSGLARLCGPRWMAMSGGQQRYALHTCNGLCTATCISVWNFDHSSQHFASCYTSTECKQSLLQHHLCPPFCGLHHVVTGKAREHDSCHERCCFLNLLHVSCTAKAGPHTWEYSGLYAPDHWERHEYYERTAESFAAMPFVQDYMMCTRS